MLIGDNAQANTFLYPGAEQHRYRTRSFYFQDWEDQLFYQGISAEDAFL